MLDITSSTALLTVAPDPLLAYVEEHAEPLRCAASLLGGQHGKRLVEDISERLAHAGGRTPVADRALDRLEALLGLDGVRLDDSIEAAAFAALDPADPVVEEICALLDGLRTARATDPRVPVLYRHAWPARLRWLHRSDRPWIATA